MNRTAICAVAASLVVLAGCGGDAGAPAAEATDVPDPAAGEVAEEPDATTDAGGADAAAGGEPTVLQASVGTPEDPEAYVITVTDAAGEPVTELPAGDYVIEVSDPATTHNFRLTGGDVNEATSVPEVVETTFEVTLEPGDYTYLCDPHPSMVGTFTVG